MHGEDSKSVWETAPHQNLVRYRPSGTYFARFKAGGKLIRRSLKTTVFSVAKLRLPDTIKAHRSIQDARRRLGQTISSDFAQVITVTFAMMVAIYYFLHQAGIRMKVFAFAIYTCGMLAYLGMMLLESAVAFGAQRALRATPQAAQALPTQYYLGVRA